MDASLETDLSTLFVVLSLNILVAFAVGLTVSAFAISLWWVHEHVRETASTVRKIVMVAVLIACIAGSAVVLNSRLAAARALPRELENFGIVVYAVEVPAFLAQRVPSSFLLPIMHAEGIHVVNPPGEMLELALQELSPRAVSVSGSTINGALWSRLVQSQTLRSLNLSGCTLLDLGNSAPTTGAALQSLTLTQCTGVDEIIPTLRQFSKLQIIDFAESPVDIALLCKSLPAELNTVRLTLDNTGCSSLHVHDLNHLESLTLRLSKRSTPSGIYSIDLCNLSQLSHLSVSSSLLFDLTAFEVPRLCSIAPIASRNRMKSDSLSIRNLVINEAPGLQEIGLGAEHLQSMVLKNTPNLRHLSIVQAEQETAIRTETGDLKLPPTISRRKKVNRWLSDIAKCDGPTSLDLSGQPLHNVDLSPIGLNSRIRELNLSETKVRASQLAEIDHGNRIKSLNLRNCKIDSDDVQLLLASYAGIERLLVDTDRLDSVDLINQPKLNFLLGSATQAAQRVRVVGCPNLTGHLILGRDLDSLELRDVASLESLSISGPVPANTVLEGLRDLEVVELASASIREEHFDALLQCKSIRELTLAIPNLPAATLRKIGQLKALTVLNVPGAQIDDDVVASWGWLRHLQEVNLSHTNVTGETLQFLTRCPVLRRLNLNHTNLQPEDLEAVSQMNYLLDIEVAGIGMTPAALRRCLQSRMVDRINLSGSVISRELLDVLVSEDANSLLFVGLKHCRLQDSDILRIALSKPSLAMDLEGNHLGESVLNGLAAQGRLISCDDMQGFRQWTERLNGLLPASNGPDLEVANLAVSERP